MTDLSAALALLTPAAVRSRAAEMLDLGRQGRLAAFALDMDRLPAAADFVVETIRRNYPSLRIPFHARWRHFCFGGRDLWAEASAGLTDPADKARAAFDLAIVSVLLDAGAGMGWRYRDGALGVETGRSEGLALASFRMFEAGAFSADPAEPLRADARRLASLAEGDIAKGFQASETNPLVGVEGRAGLLNALGRAVATLPGARPGGLFDVLVGNAGRDPSPLPVDTGRGRAAVPATASRSIPAPAILAAVLEHLGPIWPSRIVLDGVPLGDTWRHPLIAGDDPATAGLVPFHKLSQWLSYSLIEPLQAAGIAVADIDGLTGLPEYRNGGLLIDTGLLVPRSAHSLERKWKPGDEFIVEWRALTVTLLDELVELVRAQLGLNAEQLPLACVLEGGTWAAGRVLARDRREGGGPPLTITSDGTVF